jgi:hypothetical protein
LPFNEKSGIFLKRTIDIKVNNRRKRALTGVIPFPMEMDLSKLAKLKGKHGKLLTHFRSIVEQIALDSRYDDDELLDEKVIELNFHKEELGARISESKFGPILFGTVFGIAGAVYGYAQTNSWGGLIGGFPGFANAVYSALEQEDPLKTYDGSGMKYLSILESKARRNQNL